MATITAYRESDKFFVKEDGGNGYHVPSNNFEIKEISASILSITYDPLLVSTKSWTGNISEVLDKNGNAYGSSMQDVIRNIGSGIDVNIQDQTTLPVVARFTNVIAQTTLALVTAVDDKTINITSATGVIVGQHITIFNVTEERFFFAYVISISSNVITIETPLDFAFPSGSFVDFGNDDLSVNGLATTQVFGLRGGGTPTGVDLDFDITRIIFQCKTSSSADLSTFGDLSPLTNGIVLRKRDGAYENIFNVKTNGDIGGIAYDLDIHSSTNPQQGQDGFIARLTFAGQSKMGVAIRIGVGEDLEILVQDDLTGITSFKMMAEGHIVEY